MAKRKKHHRRGTGSVLQVRKLSGLGAMRMPNTLMGSLLPVAIGGVVAGGTMIGIRSFMHPDTETKANVMEYAPWIGLAAGGVAGLAMWNMSSQSAGLLTIATAGVLTLATVVGEAVAKARMTNEVTKTAGFGAIVPEYSGRQGMGAILMERAGTGGHRLGDAQRGANINLGKINTGAFGTPGFSVG
jgi:hypothetical protein